MHPSSILSYYPTYQVLDQVVSHNNYKTLNIFIDLKNNLQPLYMEHTIINIIENSRASNVLDTSIFSSLISFLSFHKIYGMKRGINLNFIIFFETGHSYYHKNVSKTYKISRQINDLFGLDKLDKDIFYETLTANLQLIEKVCNKIPSVKVVMLPNLEADFIPYYTITRNIVESGNRTANIIYSTDHDMWQALDNDVFVYSKVKQHKKIYKKNNVMNRYLKRDNSIPDEFYPLAMAVIGDPGDDVIGVHKIGPATFIKIFDELVKMTGNLEQIYDKVHNGKDLFDFVPESFVDKNLEKVVKAELEKNTISKNLKLVSFELLSRELDDPSTTEMINKRKIIERVFEEKDYPSCENVKAALEKSNILLEDGSIDFLYI